MTAHFEADVSRGVDAPRSARGLISTWFADTIDNGELQTARLLTSELVTNAVRHGQGRIQLRSKLDENCVLIEVMDEGSGLEHAVRDPGCEELDGWGLRLVESCQVAGAFTRARRTSGSSLSGVDRGSGLRPSLVGECHAR